MSRAGVWVNGAAIGPVPHPYTHTPTHPHTHTPTQPGGGTMHRWTLCLWIGAALGGGALLAAAEAQEAAPDWKVGLAQVKITPEKPVFMAGYGNRNKPFERVEADLWAKALVLEDREGRRAALVTTDLLGLPAAVAEPICERIGKRTGLRR